MYGNSLGMVGMQETQAAGMLNAVAAKDAYHQKLQTLTVRDNIEQQIAAARAEVERLEGIRDRLAPELLDQRIVDLQQAMRF